MTELVKRILAGAALGGGAIVLIASLWALLDLARIQRLRGGDVFQRDATSLTVIVVVEILGVAGGAAIIVWRRKGWVARTAVLAILVWVVAAVDFVYLALGGAVPR